MASLFFHEELTTKVAGIELFILNESYTLAGQTSSLPINLGQGEVADNFILQPTKITLTARVFNTGQGVENNCRKIAGRLENVFRQGEPISLVLALKVYEKVILSDLSISFDGQGEFIDISLTGRANEFLEYDNNGNLILTSSLVKDPIALPRRDLGGGF